MVMVSSMEVFCGLPPGGHPSPPYIGRRTRSVERSPSWLQQGNLTLVNYNTKSLSELP
jgi:hypothetical protein